MIVIEATTSLVLLIDRLSEQLPNILRNQETCETRETAKWWHRIILRVRRRVIRQRTKGQEAQVSLELESEWTRIQEKTRWRDRGCPRGDLVSSKHSNQWSQGLRVGDQLSSNRIKEDLWCSCWDEEFMMTGNLTRCPVGGVARA